MKENISLLPYNTFGIDVKARFFKEICSFEDLIAALHFAQEKGLPLLPLGGGSNLVFTQDFEGVVALMKTKGIEQQIADDNAVLITAQAGENWHQFVLYCLERNYGGIENLSLIPGNIGTAPVQNIGAYGVELKDTFYSCKVLDVESLSVGTLYLQQCNFGYRDSIFKNVARGKYIILEVSLLLTRKRHKISAEYGAIQNELDKEGIRFPTIQNVSKAVISIRQSKLPDPKIIGNCGSFFKNPLIEKTQFEALQQKFENIPNYPMGAQVKVPAAWLIEQSGWKGKTIGNVGSHAKQALVLVNVTGKATGREVKNFSQQIIDSVKEKYGIELEREVNIL